MNNTVVVITGCSSGIGLESAIYLKQYGCMVCPTARKLEDVERLKQAGFDDSYFLDVINVDSIINTIEAIMNKYHKIDVWFNNAGYGQPSMIEDLPTDILREQFETNVFGLHSCTREILKVMKIQGHGKIIQHSSVLGIISLAGRGAYNASKYAVEGHTDTLRLELRGSGVNIVTLNTDPIASNFRKNAIRMLEKNIDIEKSLYKDAYISNISGTSKKVPFSKEAISVAKVLHRIIVSKNPKPRYYITKATYLLGYLKRVLGTSMLDRILTKI